ncbi:E3 SUMO-protein ligase ZBED1 isoform X3 [Triplophysa dalaica]|uniref:E3 SUMO-protein ligase ZBED1 isoform X3 n=1 Tax=Triplophysa dalaica TaxID=1582913 RepID=UPI0024DF893C|nr:E3 SUMO-protein ligase ZBED1 isoform X3 [Triplophysa dalaica]
MPPRIKKNRVRFDLEQNLHRGRKHHSFGQQFVPLPYGRVYRRPSRSERGGKGPRASIHPVPLRSRELLPDHNLHSSPTHRSDDSRFKTLLLNRIVKDLMPLNTATGYQDLARSLSPSSHVQLNSSWFQAELKSLYRQKREEIQTAVNVTSYLVLSAELWSSNEEMFYLTVSCHLIIENWIHKSYVIDTAHLLNEHTPERVLQELLRISNEWNITEKIQVVVTNVDGMKKLEKSGCKWIFIPCFAHTLDKVFRETICDSDLKNLLRKCKQIVAFFQQNNKALESLQEHCSNLRLQRTELIQITDLKWLPTLHMLRNILALWPAIFKVFIDTLHEISINENERKILKDIVAVLNILEAVTKEIGSHEYRPISNVIPLVQKLQDELRKPENMGNKIAQTLYEKLEHHTSNIKKNHWVRMSTALDPRYKTCVLLDPTIDVKSEIRSQMTGNSHTGHSSYDARNEELEKYCQLRNISEDPLKFWRTRAEFIRLPSVARKYLTLVSTAIPMERVHQLEKSQIINRRSCLDPKNLNMILFLNAN